MIVGHVWGTSLVHRIIYPWHVPLFYVLSGYFWSTGPDRR